MPRVAVIIPVKDRAALLAGTVESLVKQTLQDWEAWVIDDHSCSSEWNVIKATCTRDPRIHLKRRTRSRHGAPACRNEGLALSNSSLVVFLDSDDQLADDALRQRVECMDHHSNLDFGLSQAWLFRQQQGDTNLLFNRQTLEDDLERFLRFDAPWQTTAPTWRRHALERLGPWDEDLVVGQDMDHSARALIAELRYERLGGNDYFLRNYNPNRTSAGSNPFTSEKLPSQIKRVETLSTLLQATGKLTPRRARLLAANYFWFARQSVRHVSLASALATWSRARQQGFTTRQQHLIGKLFLTLLRFGGAWLLAPLMVRSWPADLFICNVKTWGFPAGSSNRPIHAQPVDRIPGFQRVVSIGVAAYAWERLRQCLRSR
jgi:glycosyltransferase involved in cell wall biosynthesis